MTLDTLGWSESWARSFAPHEAAGLEPARVVCELRRNFYAVQTAAGEVLAECGGGFFHVARQPDQFPAVGDWVAVRRRDSEARADLHAVLPRRTKFSRRAAGTEGIEQIVAANVDTVILVGGLDRNFNPRRIQRFLVAAKESGATAVIVLNKSDACAEPEIMSRYVEGLVPGVPVIVTSAKTRRGLKALTAAYARPGQTLVFIGSSGVGKSSLINALMRDQGLPTAEVREKDSKGRHTTTRRELVVMPSGALLIDTPGIRELQLWSAEDGLEEAFSDLVALAAQCRFGRCTHQGEPGCAVAEAMEKGVFPRERFESYLKLNAEQAATKPKRRKPGALADKPGWRRSPESDQPFRHRQHRED
jgi:ribosome biogenesis GTPase